MGKKSKQRSAFLDDDCGQNALQLAARGSAIIAEILRLSSYIPSVFRKPTSTHEKILCGYRYFSIQDDFEREIQNSAELLQLDENFRTTHLELLDRFFKLFQGIYGYAMELQRFVADVKDGMYVSQTMESILVNADGKQLLCELYYLQGVMLLLLDYKVPGGVRELLVVSYIRYRGAGEPQTVEITAMCRSTGFEADRPLPDGYPTAYFARLPIDRSVVSLLIGRLRSDDVYQMAYNYPAPEHRCAAMANQAAMVYVLLYFQPELLTHERPVMREIVDKHFSDSWVIAYYMGFTVDMTVAWASFKAANAAISDSVVPDMVQYHQKRMKEAMVRANAAISGYLREGVLTEEFVLDNIHSTLLPCVREANVALRWFMLHMTRGLPGRRILEKYRPCFEIVAVDVTVDDVLTLLLQTAQFEFLLREMFEQFLKDKRSKWSTAREKAKVKMERLARYFSGEDVLSENVRMTQLQQWFEDIADRIDGLDYHDSVVANRKIQKLIKALEGVQEFHQLESNLQVVQFLHDTRHLLRQMIRYINIETKVLITISTVGDLSYAWELMSHHRCFVPEMQKKIRLNPHLAIPLRSCFVKLATMLELPCNRIDQAADRDTLMVASLQSVSGYYSAELVAFVRSVLHVIPTSIFEVLRDIVVILVEQLKECPTKLQRKDLKVTAQLEVRRRLSALTAKVASFARGILAMQSTLVGVDQVEPHKLLEDGIRKELVSHITNELHNALPADPKRVYSAEEFVELMQQLAKKLHGFQQAFVYIQDYVNVHGLRVWIEEFSRIVHFNVEMECNAFMQKKLYPWMSPQQSDNIPIPYFEPKNEKDTYSFLGRTLHLLLCMTDPAHATFVPANGAWFSVGGTVPKEVVGQRTFGSIAEAIGSAGLAALDRLVSHVLARELQLLLASLAKITEAESATLDAVRAAVTPAGALVVTLIETYEKLLLTLGKVGPNLVATLVRIGRLQLLRTSIHSELRACAKLNSHVLYSTLCCANDVILTDLRRHYAQPEVYELPTTIVPRVSEYLDGCGLSDAASKVYVTTRPMLGAMFVLVASVMSVAPRLSMDDRLRCLQISKRTHPTDASLDPHPFCVGLSTVMKHFHSETAEVFERHVVQLARVGCAVYERQLAGGKLPKDAPPISPAATVTWTLLRHIASTTHGGAEHLDVLLPGGSSLEGLQRTK